MLAAAWGVIGFVVANLINLLRSRVRELEYTVTHSRIALTEEDQMFGSVKATWQDAEVRNLYVTTVRLTNVTTADYTDLTFKIYTGNETLLLTERTEICGTSYILHWAPSFAARLAVASDQVLTQEQFEIHRHNREYLVQTLNRRQSVQVQLLTTVPSATQGPSVWLDLLHPGLKVRIVIVELSTLGVPNRLAQPLGIAAAIVVTVATVLSVGAPWLVAFVSCIAGFSATLLGVAVVRIFKELRRNVVG